MILPELICGCGRLAVEGPVGAVGAFEVVVGFGDVGDAAGDGIVS